MKRFFTRVGRFFGSWDFLKFVLAIVILVIFLYAEEDWRGAHAWAATKAKWEAQGETFDYAKFIPPPVPDDQNLAAIPLFKLEAMRIYNGSTDTQLVALRHAMRDDLPSLQVPQQSNWKKGELPDIRKIQKTLSDDYLLAFKNSQTPDTALAQFNAIYPFYADFFAAAAGRPDFRLNLNYTISPPVSRSLGPITDPIRLSK